MSKPMSADEFLATKKRVDEIANAIYGAVLRSHGHEIVRIIRQAGSHAPSVLRRKDYFGKTLLEEVVTREWQGVVEMIAPNSPLETTGLDGCTPLFRAVEKNHIGIVRALIANGADINTVRRTSGHTALLRAVELGLSDMALLLIEKGAVCDAFVTVFKDKSTADKALESDLPEVFFALLKKGVVNDLFPPLMMAISANALNIMRACLASEDLSAPARVANHLFAMLVASCKSEEARNIMLSWRTEQDVIGSLSEGLNDAPARSGRSTRATIVAPL